MPDLHAPYGHPDTVAFLRALKLKFTPTRVIFAGDISDHHSDSYHEKDPDMDASGREHRMALDGLKPLYRLFNVADVLESNHGALPDRKARTAGLSKAFIRQEKERLKAPTSWHWHRELIVNTPRGPILFCHGNKASANALHYSQRRGISVAQGHHHSTFACQYWSNGRVQAFALTAGCLINDASPAFDYNKDYPMRPIIGAVVILDGMPMLIPMRINQRGRWTKEL